MRAFPSAAAGAGSSLPGPPRALAVALLFAVLAATSAFEFSGYCSKMCLWGRGGNLCKCNAVHFAGKRSGADAAGEVMRVRDHDEEEDREEVGREEEARGGLNEATLDMYRQLLRDLVRQEKDEMEDRRRQLLGGEEGGEMGEERHGVDVFRAAAAALGGGDKRGDDGSEQLLKKMHPHPQRFGSDSDSDSLRGSGLFATFAKSLRTRRHLGKARTGLE